jgi:hypothetical protein
MDCRDTALKDLKLHYVFALNSTVAGTWLVVTGVAPTWVCVITALALLCRVDAYRARYPSVLGGFSDGGLLKISNRRSYEMDSKSNPVRRGETPYAMAWRTTSLSAVARNFRS